MPASKALLINPWITDFAAYDFWQRPLGLLFAASAMRDSGVDVSLIDCLDRANPSQSGLRQSSDGSGNFLRTVVRKPDALGFVPRKYCRYGISEESFEALLDRNSAPDVVLVTCLMTYWYPGAFDVIERVKNIWPRVPVILGGRYATLCAEHAKNSGADFVYSGPIGSELSKTLHEISDIKVKFPDSFEEFPAAAHDLYSVANHAAVVFSAGCPMSCSYCASRKLGGGFKRKTVEAAASELKQLIDVKGIRHIAFYDDALLHRSGEFLIPLLERVLKFERSASFYTPNALHARYLDIGVAKAMRAAGFRHIRIGFESSSKAFQNKTGGKVTGDEFGSAVEALSSAGFVKRDVAAYVMFGHPAQTEDELENTVEECIRAGITPISADYSPIPGSADFDIARKVFRRDPAEDPLLQNSSVTIYQHPHIWPEVYRALRERCRGAARKFAKT